MMNLSQDGLTTWFLSFIHQRRIIYLQLSGF